MDGSRTRRRRDATRQAWYARYRRWRFARRHGFPGPDPTARG
jgi:hypothetical protein